MKSAWFSTTLLLMILSVSLFACRDKSPSVTPTPIPVVAGKGGLATMRIFVEHTGVKVDSGKVYVKYNAVATPKDNKYDDSCAIFMSDGQPIAQFTNLTQGDYFIYGKGWDIIRSQTVSGVRPYTITADSKSGLNQLVLQTY